jgi:cyclopropane-fatty-acyl-phospholipid synthase
MAVDMVPAEMDRKLALLFLDRLFGETGGRAVGVRLWDGTCWPDDTPRRATLVLQHPSSLYAMFSAGNELSLAEAYLYNDFDIEGEIEAVFLLGDILAEATNGWRKKLSVANLLARLSKGRRR